MMEDMALMLEFSSAILDSICAFLISPPIFYFVGLICFILVCKAVKIIMR